jgi:hypothetical protein
MNDEPKVNTDETQLL